MPYLLKDNRNRYLSENWLTDHETSFTLLKGQAAVFNSMLQANRIRKKYNFRGFECEFTTRQSNLIPREYFTSLREFTI